MEFRNESLPIDEIKEILIQLNDILRDMNEKQLIYKSLKLSNILISLDKINKISIKLNTVKDSKIFLTIAPEIIVSKEDLSKSALWSIGIIIYYLCFKEYPYNEKDGKGEKDEKDLLNNINSGKTLEKLENLDNQELKDLIKKLLIINIKERISWNDYFNHSFFQYQDNKDKILKLKQEIKDLENEINRINERDSYHLPLFQTPLFTLTEHKEKVYCLTILNDGRLVSGSDDKSIIIYNKQDYKHDKIINEHKSWINYLTVLKKNGYLASCSADKTIKLFYISKDYKIIQTLYFHSDSVNQVIELTNNFLVSGSDDKTIIFYEYTNNKYINKKPNDTSHYVNNIIQTKQNEIAYSTYDNKLYFFLFDLNHDNKDLSHIDNITSSPNSFFIIRNNLLLVPGFNVINIIDLNEYKEIRKINILQGGMICGICMLNSNVIITSGEYGILRVWTIEGDYLISELETEKKDNEFTFSVLNMGNGHFACCNKSKTITIW